MPKENKECCDSCEKKEGLRDVCVYCPCHNPNQEEKKCIHGIYKNESCKDCFYVDTVSSPKEEENWEERCLLIAKWADGGMDYLYGKALAELSIDIKETISKVINEAIQEERNSWLYQKANDHDNKIKSLFSSSLLNKLREMKKEYNEQGICDAEPEIIVLQEIESFINQQMK